MASFAIDYGAFTNLVDALMKDGHIKYSLGAKPKMSAAPEDIKTSDCSGFVRYLLYNATNGVINCSPSGGTWWQNKWCKDNSLEVVEYATAADNDGWLRIAFIHGGKSKIGHVWLILGGKTIECHGGKGANRRPWDTKVLKDGVDVCYKLGLLVGSAPGMAQGEVMYA